ncbi:MAG: hypothetical protein KGN77_01930 [Xanthomonadaceae bacterium]|nr:hypothetical protein [Xanthomonadaceae bacterium]
MLGVRLDTMKSWSAGRNAMPAGAVAELRALYARIERAAAEALDVFARDGGEAEVIEIGIAGDDAEARTLGWPCLGAHEAVIGLIAARACVSVRVVPRGATLATRAASIARG